MYNSLASEILVKNEQKQALEDALRAKQDSRQDLYDDYQLQISEKQTIASDLQSEISTLQLNLDSSSKRKAELSRIYAELEREN